MRVKFREFLTRGAGTTLDNVNTIYPGDCCIVWVSDSNRSEVNIVISVYRDTIIRQDEDGDVILSRPEKETT